jgi:hypothetical protein
VFEASEASQAHAGRVGLRKVSGLRFFSVCKGRSKDGITSCLLFFNYRYRSLIHWSMVSVQKIVLIGQLHSDQMSKNLVGLWVFPSHTTKKCERLVKQIQKVNCGHVEIRDPMLDLEKGA